MNLKQNLFSNMLLAGLDVWWRLFVKVYQREDQGLGAGRGEVRETTCH